MPAGWGLVVTALFAALPAKTEAKPSPPVRIHADGRGFLDRHGRPFFYLADTNWELFLRTTREEAVEYLRVRKAQGFTVIHTAFLSLIAVQGDGTPGAEKNAYGRAGVGQNLTPLVTSGSRLGQSDQYDYWDHVDYVLTEAERMGLLVTVCAFYHSALPARDADAEAFGQFLGQHYGKRKNLIWAVSFDPPVEQVDRRADAYRAVARGIATGLSDGREDYSVALMTMHPRGETSSSRWFHGDAFLDFNMLQSRHARDDSVWEQVRADYERTPVKPVVVGESVYEAIPIREGRADAWDVRKAAYTALLAGAAGITYGHNDVAQMYARGRKPWGEAQTPWRQSLTAPGALSMTPLRRLFESRGGLPVLPHQDMIRSVHPAETHVQAAKTEKSVFVYSSRGEPFTLVLAHVPGKTVRVWWFNPRTGAASRADDLENHGEHRFEPPSQGHDWLLVLDGTSAPRIPPGKPAQRSRME